MLFALASTQPSSIEAFHSQGFCSSFCLRLARLFLSVVKAGAKSPPISVPELGCASAGLAGRVPGMKH